MIVQLLFSTLVHSKKFAVFAGKLPAILKLPLDLPAKKFPAKSPCLRTSLAIFRSLISTIRTAELLHLENSFEMAEKNCSSLQKITDLLTLRITQNIIVNHLQLELAIIQNE